MPRTHRRLRTWALARQFRGRAPRSPAIRVEHVDDPELPFRLVRAAGVLSPSSIDRLLDAWVSLTAPYALHLDLGDAQIDDEVTMRRLEMALDHLERQQIEVRLVGIDPHHPVLHR